MELEKIGCLYTCIMFYFSHFKGNIWLKLHIMPPDDVFSFKHKFILMKDKIKPFFLS